MILWAGLKSVPALCGFHHHGRPGSRKTSEETAPASRHGTVYPGSRGALGTLTGGQFVHLPNKGFDK